MLALEQFKLQLTDPQHRFADSLAFIEQHYDYQPTAFSNGSVHNALGENSGSCKIFALALLENLSAEQALLAFGEHYRHVQASPDGVDHQNIRQFLMNGLAEIHYQQPALKRKANT